MTTTSPSPDMPPVELTLIVAATRSMGIGRGGTLPWTGLKQEMAYFARVTKRLPPGVEGQNLRNKVIMGRKTWASIPPRFRPLKDRENIVLSRQPPPPPSTANDNDARWFTSLPAAIQALQAEEQTAHTRVFIIGGAEIYKAALELPQAKRVLLTRVLSEFECDTTFPIKLGPEGDEGLTEGWVRKSKADLDAWTGETVPEGEREENGTKYIFEMYERR